MDLRTGMNLNESVICLDDEPQMPPLYLPSFQPWSRCCCEHCGKLKRPPRNQQQSHLPRNLAKDMKPAVVIDLSDSLSEEPCERRTAFPGECGICLEPLSSAQELATTMCGHIFCKKCLIEAMIQTRKCPKCRRFIKDLTEIITLYP